MPGKAFRVDAGGSGNYHHQPNHRLIRNPLTRDLATLGYGTDNGRVASFGPWFPAKSAPSFRKLTLIGRNLNFEVFVYRILQDR